MKLPKAAVIGSGFSGLSVATHLAQGGWDVEIYEKNAAIGGRARSFSASGFTFDMGPSWYWMPDVFEDYFARFGRKPQDYYNLKRLDPSYGVCFNPALFLDIPSSLPELSTLFEQIEPGGGMALRRFLKDAEAKYRVSMKDMVYKPGLNIGEFFNPKVLSGALHLQLFRSMSAHVRKYFKDPRLIQLLEFPVLFLGAKPSKTPAMYSLMNYADMVLGTWYPDGGMYKIVEAMAALAKEQGVKIHCNAEVSHIRVEAGRTRGITTHSGFKEADVVVSSADYHHTEQQLLEAPNRNYGEAYWQSREMAPSALIFYLGIGKKIKGIRHHNLFFDADFARHTSFIYDTPGWPEEPLFYVSATSVTDTSTAPEGCENLFVLIPSAPGLDADPDILDKYYHRVVARMEKAFKQEIGRHVIYRRNFAPGDFAEEYHAFKNNAYGLANTLRQTAVMKPSIRNKRVKNLYYTGQLTVPGPGVPPALVSGKIVADQILKNHSKSIL